MCRTKGQCGCCTTTTTAGVTSTLIPLTKQPSGQRHSATPRSPLTAHFDLVTTLQHRQQQTQQQHRAGRSGGGRIMSLYHNLNNNNDSRLVEWQTEASQRSDRAALNELIEPARLITGALTGDINNYGRQRPPFIRSETTHDCILICIYTVSKLNPHSGALLWHFALARLFPFIHSIHLFTCLFNYLFIRLTNYLIT